MSQRRQRRGSAERLSCGRVDSVAATRYRVDASEPTRAHDDAIAATTPQKKTPHSYKALRPEVVRHARELEPLQRQLTGLQRVTTDTRQYDLERI